MSSNGLQQADDDVRITWTGRLSDRSNYFLMQFFVNISTNYRDHRSPLARTNKGTAGSTLAARAHKDNVSSQKRAGRNINAFGTFPHCYFE